MKTLISRQHAVKALISRQLGRLGYSVAKIPVPAAIARTHPDLESGFTELYARCAWPRSVTSAERMYATWQAVRQVHARGVPGDLVECGVWRGGNAMLMALTLVQVGDGSRRLFLYDTFDGMNEPTPRDIGPEGESVIDSWDSIRTSRTHPLRAWCPRSVVEGNMALTGFRQERVIYVEGPVEDTIPSTVPAAIAVLRLDTDWYRSTRHELEHLWPLLSPGGILLIDDYGYWAGAREAVEEFFADRSDAPLLARTDGTGRLAVKS